MSCRSYPRACRSLSRDLRGRYGVTLCERVRFTLLPKLWISVRLTACLKRWKYGASATLPGMNTRYPSDLTDARWICLRRLLPGLPALDRRHPDARAVALRLAVGTGPAVGRP